MTDGTSYEDWERVQGIPELHELERSRRREDAREDAARIKAAGGFDADLFYGEPSYATGGAAGRHSPPVVEDDELTEEVKDSWTQGL